MSDLPEDKVNVTKDGDHYKATVTRHFDNQDQAANWGDTMTTKDTPEKAASEMTPEDAEEINSNVNAPVPQPGADQNVSGAGSDDTESGEGNGNRKAPHYTPEKANDDTSNVGANNPTVGTRTEKA